MTNETVVSTTNQQSPSAELAIKLQTGIAAAQTAYSLNNGGGLIPGEPLRTIEDSSLINAAGARPLNIEIPDGYVVQGVYKNTITGLDAYFAANLKTKQFLVGFAGTNGFGKDRPDTYQDVVRLGVGHAQELIENKKFREDFKYAVEYVGGIDNVKDFLTAGQSLAAAAARIFGAMAIYGAPNSLDESALRGLGLRPNQISVVGINGLATEYGLNQAGFSSTQISEFNLNADLNLIVTKNSITGTIDFVSQTGGNQGGSIWALEVKTETSMAGLHRMNYGVAEGLALIGGDLTKLTPLELTPFSHQTISDNLNNIQNAIPIANNSLSLTWSSYVSILFSKPGETAAGISLGLQTYLGIPKPLANVLGAAAELSMRTLPITRVAQAIQLLIGGYALGQAVGSQTTAEVSFPTLQSGWTRTNLTPSDSEAYLQGWRFVLDTNSQTGVQVVRSGGGYSEEVHPDGTIIYSHPQFGLGVFNPDGSGTLHLKEIDPLTGDTSSAHVSIEANTHIELTADGWRTVKPLDATGDQVQLTYYTGTKRTIYEGSYNIVDKEGKPARIFSISNEYHASLATDFSLPEENLSWTVNRSDLGNGHILIVTRDDDRRVVKVVEEKILETGRRLVTTSDGSGTIHSTRLEEKINANTARTITRDGDGKITEIHVVQIYSIDKETFVLDDVANHTDNTRTLTVRDTNGNIKKTENIAVDAAPLQMTDKASKEMQTDVVSFLNALRQKDKAGIIISTARLVLDYAHTQGVVPVAYDTVVGDASSALNFVGSLRALQSGDMLTQVGGAVGLLNTTNYFASRMAANNTGFLSTTQTQALNTVGAILSIANLANLGSMIDNHQFGSAAATVVAAANSIAYLTSASSSLMGTGALFPINPIAMIVIAYALDTMFAEDPPPPPPQGVVHFVCEADGRLGYRITECNDLGKSILSGQVDLLLPKLEAQLAQANGGIFDNDHALLLVASRMPAVRLSAWPSHADNGVSNYFFVLEQSDPLKDDPNYVGVARQDLLRLYAETLVLPEALVQRWEVDHLRQKFGPDEANWQTEGEWLRGRSPTEKQRALLQKEVDRSTAAWQASATVKLALSSWFESGNVAVQKQNDAAQEASRLCMEEAKAALAAYTELHPLDPFEVARATPEQERDFAQTHQARETVSLQWLKVITVDLGGDGVSLKDLPGNVGTDLDSLRQQHVARFDVDGDGFVEATQWIAPSEAILGIDRSGNGLIDNGSELFNETDTPFDQHGLAELAYYDANGDGRITEADPVYKQLRLWVDLDSDGSAGALEVFDMQMHSALSGAACSAAPSGTTDALAAMVVTAIDLSTMRMQFADGSSAALSDTALLSHTKGLKIVMDEATANLNVLHEDGLRENFITLTQDMSVLQELQSATLSSTRRTELEALARRYGLNPASADFAGIVQSLRATGETLGQQDTVIYFGDDAVWVDPQVRQRLEQMRISFRKLGDRAADSIASTNQLGRFGAAPDSQALNADGSFNDRWVASHKLSAVDIISDAASVPETENSQPEQWLLPADVYSLLQVTKGAKSGGLVTEQAIIASDRAFPQAQPQTIQVFATAQPVAQLRPAQLSSDEDGVVSFSYTQLEQEARLLLGASVQLLGIRSARHGTVQLDDAAGRLSFNAQTNYTGEAGFTIVLMNQQGQVLEREIAIDLREVNDAPVVAGETIRSREDIPLLIDTAMLLANDHDMEADAMRITGIGRVGLGKAELLGNGQIHYTPPSDQYGITDTLEYIVQDSRGASSVGKINITLDPVDDAPSVVSERIINAREDQTLRIASRLLLWNDIDLDTDARLGAAPLTITAVGSPEHGKVRLESGGEIVFVPDANYNGEAAFNYTVRDETGLSTTGRALIRIDPVNDAPLVAGEQIASKEDERLVIDPTLLLTNEFDLDITRGEKQSLSLAAVDQATGGRVQMQDGLIVFVPDANLHGEASFRYTVSDGDGGFAQGKVAITLAPVNDGPVLPAVSLTAAEDTTLLIPTARLQEGVSDVDGENTSFQLLSVDNAIGGTVEWLNQQVIFHPDANYAGTASFCYTVADAEGACSTGVAAININNVNDAPALIAGSRFEPAGEEDQEIRISESALVKLFLDADGDSMQLAASTLCAENAGDSIRFDSTKRELVFRAAENANGLREIRYAVTDGQAISAMQTLNITLRPVNDAPIVNAVGFQMLEDGGQTNPDLNAWSYLSYASLLCNSSDPDGDALTVSAVADGQTADKVRLAVQVVNDVANKRIAIKAPLNYNGAIELSFTVQDSKGANTTQKAYGMVTPVNDTPLLSVQKTGSKEIRIAFTQVTQETWKINAWDPDANDTVSFMVERNPLRGAVSLGAATTTPDPSGGVRVEAMITTLSGFGSVKSTEAAWFSASDKAGAKSLINIAFTGRYDPIVIDLGQDGLGFINIANSQVWLDTQGDGVLRRSAWIGSSEAILAWDIDQNDFINLQDEITFASHLGADMVGQSDLQALQQTTFDQNQDGIFDGQDPKWQQFKLWRDFNSNGISEAGELQSLEEAGVKSLFLAANVLNRAEGPDVRVRGYTRLEMTDGRLLQAADVWLNTEQDSEHDIEKFPPFENAQQASLLGSDQLQSLLAQLAATPTGSNHAPLLYGYVPTQYAQEGEWFHVDIAPNMFIDPDERNALQFRATQADGSALPDWLHFDAERLRFEGQPGFADAGNLQIALTASDRPQSETTAFFNLITSQINHAPQLQGSIAIIGWQVGQDNTYQLPPHLFSDDNQDDHLFIDVTLADGSALPDWMHFDAASQTLTGKPDASQLATPVGLRISATDLAGASVTTLTSLAALTQGSAGNDYLRGTMADEVIWGEAGDDTLEGQSGNDELDGGIGNDTYVFDYAFGEDVINEIKGNTNEVNTIRFLSDVSPKDIYAYRDFNSLCLYVNDNKFDYLLGKPAVHQSISLNNFYKDKAWSTIQSIQFSNGEVWSDLRSIRATLVAVLTEGDDVFNADDYQDSTRCEIVGLDGNDTLIGSAGNNQIFAGAGNDTLNGGADNDYLEGDEGNDTYVFGQSWGADKIEEKPGTGEFNVIQFEDGILPADLQLSRNLYALMIKQTGTANSITVSPGHGDLLWLDPQQPSVSPLIAEIRFANGETWSGLSDQDIAFDGVLNYNMPEFSGTQRNDKIWGSYGNQRIAGLGGDDYLDGGEGNDQLSGGAGNDVLVGGADDDIYQFNRGDGSDQIIDTGGTDVLQFDALNSFAELSFSRVGNDLTAGYINTTDSITMKNFYTASGAVNTASAVDSFRLSNGNTLSASAVASLAGSTALSTSTFSSLPR